MAQCGDKALSSPKLLLRLINPKKARDENHTNIIGLNNFPTKFVPRY